MRRAFDATPAFSANWLSVAAMVDRALVRPADPPEPPLAETYRQLAQEDLERRPIDVVLRGLDLVLATVAVVVLAPVIGTVALVVRVSSGRPIFYRGARVGRGGELYTMYKFRTLSVDAEQRLGPFLGAELAQLTSVEVTPVGRLLRASHLDELPQLLNVVRGDMSIVGPRPIRPAFLEELFREIPQYWQRLVVRPGMAGFAQLRMTREMTWSEKLSHDLEYIADRSVRLYAVVIAQTAWRILTRVVVGLLRPKEGGGD
jgi:lipopolysaccharide/colanic/teichoic acid biosynthesis glycosyltransferase